MPSRNVLKNYLEDGVYHVYNRGVERRDIFLDNQDYEYFLYLLKTYLVPPQKGWDPVQGPTLREKPNFADEIVLLAYCLMPNHFHLLIKQKNIDSMPRFVKCVCTNYSMYFNKKYDRVGSLFQGHYKAILIANDNYLLHLTRYIHLNPTTQKGWDPVQGPTLLRTAWSSYENYLGLRRMEWLDPGLVLGLFDRGVGLYGDSFGSYKSFVENYAKDATEILGRITLE